MIIKTTFKACMLISLVLAGAVTAEAKTLRYAELGPNRGARAEALKWFAEELSERTDGSLKIEFHWGQSLMKGNAVLSGLKNGVADMGTVIGFFTPRNLRGYNIGDLPVDNSDEWVGMRAMYDLSKNNPIMQKEFSGEGVVFVTNYTTGPVQLICSSPMSNLADLKGVKVRASGPYGKALSDLGAEVVRMSQGDAQQALSSGLITCNQGYYYSMKAYKQYEVAENVLELNWGQNMSFGIMLSNLAWSGLKENERAVINDLGTEFIDYFSKKMIDDRISDKRLMEDGIDGKSIKVVEISDDDRSKLISASNTYIDKWVKEATDQGKDGKSLLSAYEKLITTYDSKKKESGYPWSQK